MRIKTVLFLTILFTSNLIAAVGDWYTFTNQSDIRDMAATDGEIWCATNGGVFRFSLQDSSFTQFNNTNGLSSLGSKAIIMDSRGNVWVGFSDGNINHFDVATQKWSQINDYVGHEIFDLQIYGDSLLVALDIGISLYDIPKREVKETYKNLGQLIPVETPVHVIYIKGKEIWAGTDYGLAKSSFDLANLMAPESWTNYSMLHGLPSNLIIAISSVDDQIFVATDSGIAVKDTASNLWNLSNDGLSNLTANDLAVGQNNELFALVGNYIYKFNSGINSWEIASPYIYMPARLRILDDGSFCVGRKKTLNSGGIALLNQESSQWREFIPPGPPGNEISCMKMDDNGILWCGTIGDGLFRYNPRESDPGQQWQQFTMSQGLARNTIEAIEIDNLNRKWIATRGGGISILDDRNSDVTITNIGSEALAGISSDPNYILITDIKRDRYNNMWILNLEALNNKIVAVYSALQQWQYFSRQEGFLSSDVRALDFDQYDRVWIASDGGVNVIDYNNTLMDKSDDDLSGTLTTVDGLEANKVKDLAIDQDNIAWIATEDGLNYWAQGNVYYQGGLISNNINRIEVDVRNNKWFGTSGGVSVLAPDGITFTHYTKENSPLVSDNVTCFAFDPETGGVYIGTTEGISLVITPYSRPRENLNNLLAGPNPFFPERDNYFSFANLADDVDIRILTENGAVIRTISKDEILGSQALWDGKNDQGNYVASGIYLYIVFNKETGLNRVGKIAVIR